MEVNGQIQASSALTAGNTTPVPAEEGDWVGSVQTPGSATYQYFMPKIF
jgi:hypothetical protein